MKVETNSMNMKRRIAATGLCMLLAGWLYFGWCSLSFGQLSQNDLRTLECTNGMRFSGRFGSLPKMGATNADLSADAKSAGIVLIDDDLREIFVSRHNVANDAPLDRFEEEFEIWQKVHNGDGLGTEIGDILGTQEFDQYGRRLITIGGRRGAETVFQGITRINPRYVRLQGLVNTVGPEAHWDMRLALSSVPTRVLVDVLERQIKDADDANERMRLVDFFVQARKYREAESTLRAIALDFPGLKEELGNRSKLLLGQISRQVLDEARLRRESGQQILASDLIARLEKSDGIATGILVEINDVKQQMAADVKQVEETRRLALEIVERILAKKETAGELRTVLEVFAEEIKNELGLNNQERLSTFVRLSDDPDSTDEQKISLALSGWIIGAGSAMENIGESQSLLKTRGLVVEYLRTPRIERRLEILRELETLETGAPEYLDKVIKHIKPPLAPSNAEIPEDKPISLEIEVPVRAGKPPETARYLVQLPPEYDPYRRYPCILTLGGSTISSTPEAQINWWAGPYHPRMGIRTGQASRHGYIVISPDWMKPEQIVYEHSAREHAIVLKTLRDALRRFSIDTNRVFLTGHFAGANAAWDIGQAHPEHWTGVMPLSARVDRYINHYHSNGKYHTRWYFVNGARDFDSKRANSTVWNKQMISRDFDSIIVHYHGRGTEKFSDELPNLFLWMSPQRRQFSVRNFECASMRPWDNYFWWFEVDLSGNAKMLLPEEDWNSAERSRWDIIGKIDRQNHFYLKGASDDAVVWLLPELVDFSLNVEIEGQSGKFKGGVKPSRKTLLEDVRTRADRQHPYWAKIVRRQKKWKVEE